MLAPKIFLTEMVSQYVFDLCVKFHADSFSETDLSSLNVTVPMAYSHMSQPGCHL